ncbi:MAG: hypothetical protein AMXMBFR84_01090 [Candidatus Hydrogenedentota bacterium]
MMKWNRSRSREIAGFAWLALMATLLPGQGCPTVEPAVVGYPGPLTVVQYETTFLSHNLPLTIAYPAEKDQGPFPLVVLHSGWNQPRGAYYRYAQTLAQWGYVCIIRAFPEPALFGIGFSTRDAQLEQGDALLDWADAENVNPESPLFGLLDMDHIGVTGHSQGGQLALASAFRNPRFDAVVSLDNGYEQPGYELGTGFAHTAVPVMWLMSEIGYCAGREYSPYPIRLFDYAVAPVIEVTVLGSAHIDFLESSPGPNSLGQIFCGGGTRDQNEVRALAQRYMVAWFDVYLKGNLASEDTYRGAGLQADIDSGWVSARSKL